MSRQDRQWYLPSNSWLVNQDLFILLEGKPFTKLLYLLSLCVLTVCRLLVKVPLKTALDFQVNQEPLVYSLSADWRSKQIAKQCSILKLTRSPGVLTVCRQVVKVTLKTVFRLTKSTWCTHCLLTGCQSDFQNSVRFST